MGLWFGTTRILPGEFWELKSPNLPTNGTPPLTLTKKLRWALGSALLLVHTDRRWVVLCIIWQHYKYVSVVATCNKSSTVLK